MLLLTQTKLNFGSARRKTALFLYGLLETGAISKEATLAGYFRGLSPKVHFSPVNLFEIVFSIATFFVLLRKCEWCYWIPTGHQRPVSTTKFYSGTFICKLSSAMKILRR